VTRFRDLPGGIDRANYAWPIVSVIHPDHGVYEMAVHCLRAPDGAMCLVAFGGPLGHTRPASPERRKQVDLVADIARGMGDVIEPLEESDISGDIAELLAAHFHAHPDTGVFVMQVSRP
jgi:hypothetical protein